MSSPVGELEAPVRALFTDLDGTLTTNGRVEASTHVALQEIVSAGIDLVIVTGRPAGWGQALTTTTPAMAVVTENGGVTFVRAERGWRKIYGVSAASLPEWRRKMHAAAVDVMNEVSGARLSSDSKYREVDLAIDWNEDVSLPKADAEQAVAMLRQQGFTAVRSSVHVNFGPPKFDKLSACKVVIEHALNRDPNDLSEYVYIGDALNDAPMFAGFDKSIGVGNLRKWWDELEHKPKYMTEADEGAGLREAVAKILSLR